MYSPACLPGWYIQGGLYPACFPGWVYTGCIPPWHASLGVYRGVYLPSMPPWVCTGCIPPYHASLCVYQGVYLPIMPPCVCTSGYISLACLPVCTSGYTSLACLPVCARRCKESLPASLCVTMLRREPPSLPTNTRFTVGVYSRFTVGEQLPLPLSRFTVGRYPVSQRLEPHNVGIFLIPATYESMQD